MEVLLPDDQSRISLRTGRLKAAGKIYTGLKIISNDIDGKYLI